MGDGSMIVVENNPRVVIEHLGEGDFKVEAVGFKLTKEIVSLYKGDTLTIELPPMLLELEAV